MFCENDKDPQANMGAKVVRLEWVRSYDCRRTRTKIRAKQVMPVFEVFCERDVVGWGTMQERLGEKMLPITGWRNDDRGNLEPHIPCSQIV